MANHESLNAPLLPGVIFAGLGRDCQVGYRLRKSEFTAVPMPFDFMWTPGAALQATLASDLRRFAAREDWVVRDDTLVHRTLPMRICHLRRNDEVGAKIALARLAATTRILRDYLSLPVPVVFIRLAEDELEFRRSTELLDQLRRFVPRANLVHVLVSDGAAEWRQVGSAVAQATVRAGSTWRGDRASWRQLLVRAHAWCAEGAGWLRRYHGAVRARVASHLLGPRWGRIRSKVAELAASARGARIDPMILAALVQAEDHRFYWHNGVDWARTARAATEWALRHQGGGGSTIEQQLVRVVTGEYERTLGRKLREVVAGGSLGVAVTKAEVLRAYLEAGYFGVGMIGVHQASRKLELDPANVGAEGAAEIVAHLRFPWSPAESAAWRRRRKERTRWILSRLT